MRAVQRQDFEASGSVTGREMGVNRSAGPSASSSSRSSANPSSIAALCRRGLVALTLIASSACSWFEAGPEAALAAMQQRFLAPWTESTYMIATVDTPQGLWNVYVVSIPPNQVAVRQSRQDGEYEFGMIDDRIWHIALGRTAPTLLGSEWAWFLRLHEMYRFSDWLASLQELSPLGSASTSNSECSLLSATDRFGLPVRICADAEGWPLWIERDTPAAYGDGAVRIEVRDWMEHDGKPMFRGFVQRQGENSYAWEIQGVLVIPPEDAKLTAPEGLVPMQ